MINETDDYGYVILKCSTCLGSGKRWFICDLNSKTRYTKYKMYECNHCNGSGYLERDWVSAVYEKSIGDMVNNFKTRTLKANWTIETKQDIQAIFSEELANEFAKRIDEEILEMLKGEAENENVDGKPKNDVSKTPVWGTRRNPYDIGNFET
jgi:hypothetical protein